MSSKHLTTGSTNPPLQEGKLRLYSMRFCPYAQRVHLVVAAKQIPHDVVYINLTNKPEWYLEKFPLGKVPALIVDGEDLYESLIISDFLDEKYPARPLHPKDPMKKAKDRIFVEGFSKVIGTMYKMYYSPTLEQNLLDDLTTGLEDYERELVKRGTPFFGGDKPGMADYMIWPWIERLEMVRIIAGDQFKVTRDKFLRLTEWSKAMLEDEAVKSHYLEPEVHAKFLRGRRAGLADYDIL